MKTYISEIIPKIKRYSERLDNLTLLTNQHWIVIDELQNSKNVYIFRSNNELLISQNGKVEKAKWEYLGSNALLIDRKEESYLFKHGFFDSNVLALQVDGSSEYAFLVNESKFNGELNSPEKITDFLTEIYIKNGNSGTQFRNSVTKRIGWNITRIETNKGIVEVETKLDKGYSIGDNAFLNGAKAEDGNYVVGWPSWSNFIVIKDGKIAQL
jgi:hypothetical protein